ncbi:MAG TPA: alpha/beta hydrolase [Clostridiaceae bacterium]|nr:alpha/beta hydrolase [Clostridiaceae bacterium]
MIPYNEYGKREKPTILLLHGAAVLDTFYGQYSFSEHYHLVVPHLHGAGKSADRVYDPEALKHEIFEVIDSLNKDKIGVIGYSLGAQLAIMLVCERPEQFSFAVFLSAWVNPKPKIVRMYCSLAGIIVKILHCKWFVRLQAKYWNFTKEQADYMAEYSQLITPQVYKSFFMNTLDLQKLPKYMTLNVPMLAICGSKEVKDMKISLHMLGRNPHCQTIMLPKANHNYPMRNTKQLNKILEKFILEWSGMF